MWAWLVREGCGSAEHRPSLFPGGESDWINMAVLSAESVSLAGSPAGTCGGSLPYLHSRAVFLLCVCKCS